MKTINTYINEKLRLSAKPQYTCQPKTTDKLQRIIIKRINDEGPNCDLNDIDTSKITDMSYLFDTTRSPYGIFRNFNGDISQWNVSNVTSMHMMFFGCKKFNCDLSLWNVSNVRDMYGMFSKCEQFNSDISHWNVSNVWNISWMFNGCKKFNQDLNSWDVSNIDETHTYNAFYKCSTKPTWYDKSKCESV